jgi:hypothetical protein
MTTNKLKLSLVAAGSLALSMAPITSMATPINGTISFFGNVTPFTGPPSSPGVTIASDYTTAQSLVFGFTQAASGANGSFASVTAGTVVTMNGPLGVNPAVINSSGPLWSVGGFTFTLTTLTESLDTPTVLVLSGSGMMSDGIAADNNMGTWVATFTSASSGPGVTFSWNSSSGASIPTTVVPETGASLLMMGMGLAGLGVFAKFRKQFAFAKA